MGELVKNFARDVIKEGMKEGFTKITEALNKIPAKIREGEIKSLLEKFDTSKENPNQLAKNDGAGSSTQTEQKTNQTNSEKFKSQNETSSDNIQATPENHNQSAENAADPLTSEQLSPEDELANNFANQDEALRSSLKNSGQENDFHAYAQGLDEEAPQRIEWLKQYNQKTGSKKTPEELEEFEKEYRRDQLDKKEKELDKNDSYEQYEKNSETLQELTGKDPDSTDALSPEEVNNQLKELTNKQLNNPSNSATVQPVGGGAEGAGGEAAASAQAGAEAAEAGSEAAEAAELLLLAL